MKTNFYTSILWMLRVSSANFKPILKTMVAFCIAVITMNVQAQDEDVLFQAFDWNNHIQPAGTTWYNVVSNNRTTIKNAGIDVIWMPPPSNSAAPQGYLPRELYNFNTAYGTEAQLRSLITAYHGSGIKVLSDIVINHRVGTSDAVTFTNPAWPTFYITADDEGRNFVNYPVTFSINGDYVPGSSLKSDGSNGTFAAARDLDHKNPAVRNEIKTWLLYLKNNLGFDGWRYDFVHGYDPIYNKEYNDATSPYFAVGELLESSRVQTNNWVSFTQQSSSAFDFNTKVTLQNALRDNNLSYLRDGAGKPSGMIGINPSKSVTFLDNHDTGFKQQCCGSNYVFPSDEVNLGKGYAYILTHPGNPMVFWTHFFDSGTNVRTAITNLIAARKSARVFAGSTINIVEARQNLYAAYIDGRAGTIAMKIGSGAWSPNGTGWQLSTSGVDYAVWVKPNTTTPPVTVAPFTVNFHKPTNWGTNMRAYLFNSATNTTLPGTAAWPGNGMTRQGTTNWYSYNVTPPAGVAATNLNVIFNDGTNQTADLQRSTTGWYKDTTWTNTCTTGCVGTTTATTINYNFLRPTSGWGTGVRVYFYNTANNTTLAGTPAWPGATMTANTGTNWFTKDLVLPSGVAASNVGIVFNNGSTTQTVDLTRSTSGWFTVTGTNSAGRRTGTWSNTCTSGCPAKTAQLFTKDEVLVSVYPNPMTDTGIIKYTLTDASDAQIQITDLAGRVVYRATNKSQAGANEFAIQREDLKSVGVYLVQVSSNGNTLATTKLVVE